MSMIMSVNLAMAMMADEPISGDVLSDLTGRCPIITARVIWPCFAGSHHRERHPAARLLATLGDSCVSSDFNLNYTRSNLRNWAGSRRNTS